MDIRSRGPMIECFYDVAPRIWSPAWVRERPNSRPGDDEDYRGYLYYYFPEAYSEMQLEDHSEPQPDSFTWLRRGPLHALVGMQRGNDLNPFWVPLMWFGTHPQKSLAGHAEPLIRPIGNRTRPGFRRSCSSARRGDCGCGRIGSSACQSRNAPSGATPDRHLRELRRRKTKVWHQPSLCNGRCTVSFRIWTCLGS